MLPIREKVWTKRDPAEATVALLLLNLIQNLPRNLLVSGFYISAANCTRAGSTIIQDYCAFPPIMFHLFITIIFVIIIVTNESGIEVRKWIFKTGFVKMQMPHLYANTQWFTWIRIWWLVVRWVRALWFWAEWSWRLWYRTGESNEDTEFQRDLLRSSHPTTLCKWLPCLI